MGPSKRKGSVRRQVLDLNTTEDSPSRPTWQTKYQHVLPGEEVHQNGDSQTSSSPIVINNPLSGLLGNYNSDSDSEESTQKPASNLDAKVEDFLKEIQSISVETTSTENQTTVKQSSEEEVHYPASVTAWQQCYDHNSGYPYYWNTETNEVTWEMPADLKAALASVALKHQQQQQQQQKQEKPQKQQPKSEPETQKKVVKYPWQTESDSEDEKIEMITSFGPQSGEESEGEEQKKPVKSKKSDSSTNPSLPTKSLSYINPSKIRSDSITLAPEDPEGLNESSYETSSLLTHGVQDTGPPGDDSFNSAKPTFQAKVPASSTKEESAIIQSKSETTNSRSDCSSVQKIVSSETLATQKQDTSVEETVSECKDKVNEVIAQAEKEILPDVCDNLKSEKQTNSSEAANPAKTESGASQTVTGNPTNSSLTLVASYGDDSESEDNSVSEKLKNSSRIHAPPSKPLFPIEIPQEKVKPLFPCMGGELPKISVEVKPKVSSQDEPEPVSNIYNTELDDPAAQKAFKRKKRIEFATTVYGPSTSKSQDAKAPEHAVSVPTTQYNLDPNSNDHHGFGFNAHKAPVDTERKTYKNYGGIQFIKAETINLAAPPEPKEKCETEIDNPSAPRSSSKESVRSEEIEDAASLLREKVTFLTGGTSQISPIQQMAIELETLVLAWQHGALTPSYLLRWLNEKCSELIRHEKTAAPPGWTCLWDRKSKRYFYRNTTTKAILWEYPNVEEKSKGKDDVEGCGDEMDICDTPPHMSPAGPERQTDETPSTPPPPVISGVSENVSSQSPTPQPPPPPQISFCPENESSSAKIAKKKKRKADEMGTSGEVDAPSGTSVTESVGSYDHSCESIDSAPPLPPMPPPPPPPPAESPPPLPDSPPPLPLEPDQPLPPGVDEPEYTLYRPPKNPYKKSQTESPAYSAELMMTYGYGLPVQQVVSSNSAAMTMQMQPLEYHPYIHEPVSNHYMVQSAPTSHVIHCPAKKPKPSIASELVSFYSDLAMMDSSTADNSSTQTVPSTPAPPPPKETPPAPPPVQTTVTVAPSPSTKSSVATSSSSSSAAIKTTDSVTSNGVNVKKKKKTKTTSTLSLKKKGVSSLVAKWQQVQQEVRRDFSDDDDDAVSTK